MEGVGDLVELSVSAWVNSPPIDLADLRGRVVMIETFQMLCPGCISHGLPLAQRVHRSFPDGEVTVLGLHTVFEHHDVMGPDALAVFVAEYRIEFPVGVDRNEGRGIPETMGRYGLRGTPSTLLLDREGRLRRSIFGAVDDLSLGVLLGRLLSEDTPAETA
ncbi:MAG: TlpA family protein disulfide reductase [Acidimicrobiia bacterium]|nr:TlpA family protein disulfide reductase [Acidimicrobiia bacterium]